MRLTLQEQCLRATIQFLADGLSTRRREGSHFEESQRTPKTDCKLSCQSMIKVSDIKENLKIIGASRSLTL